MKMYEILKMRNELRTFSIDGYEQQNCPNKPKTNFRRIIMGIGALTLAVTAYTICAIDNNDAVTGNAGKCLSVGGTRTENFGSLPDNMPFSEDQIYIWTSMGVENSMSCSPQDFMTRIIRMNPDKVLSNDLFGSGTYLIPDAV